jgi:hypothetical protein
MTEAEWLACDRTRSLLVYAEGSVSWRKVALYHVACCCSLISEWEDGHPILDFISAVEACADDPRVRADDRSRLFEHSQLVEEHLWHLIQETRGRLRHRVLGAANLTVAHLLLTVPFDDFPWWRTESQIDDRLQATRHALTWGRLEKACDENVSLLRDVFGNPFRSVTFSPSWRTDTAVSLAKQMYESRDFSAMPILADALQDAGCDNDEVLSHCRDAEQPHVRGCWVVDGVLGKA